LEGQALPVLLAPQVHLEQQAQQAQALLLAQQVQVLRQVQQVMVGITQP
jgi:hypothetical protein